MTEKLKEAIAHIETARELLDSCMQEDKPKAENKDKKVTITFKVGNVFDDKADLTDEELEQLKKDLEEIVNDFTRE